MHVIERMQVESENRIAREIIIGKPVINTNSMKIEFFIAMKSSRSIARGSDIGEAIAGVLFR